MRIHSDSFEHRARLPVAYAAGQATGEGFGFAPNRNPQLSWDDVPPGTKSFALLCIDPDVPTVAEMVGKDGVLIPADQPRCDFYHWVMVDIPADVRALAAGACSDGFTARGKAAPQGPAGSRQGCNDYTGWFAGDADMAGDYLGYDGPFPPPNDLRLHRYFFRVYALDIERLPLSERFDGSQALSAMHGHVLAEATIHATYSLNADVKG
ncbi:YbhB/YbcL family Raf kinase inhibitor-like protein [Montanilutibacter psychrotolerans]|uniref:YbhB/YbcL family Raf kinase inhibitor-like protein n=1 Tax=Montanilutibacter psychrotolerans TaxID=1327343 RepID=A0A3M8SS74_9GAMM|nr:YbhB/YbcL family Raf kinase inhibitor-like protein [Lysobacter psychrotolerans]RNF83623.1 YbhB/YbcL family Raf kinase inhibitor-like protein [Lysobacter psychrotolerans]